MSVKRIFLASSVLLFSEVFLAYGQTPPSATLTVQVIPGSNPTGGACGTPLGDAAADVAALGWSTCVLYNDFTTQVPNQVGTGLPNNWLDCKDNDTNPPSGTAWGLVDSANAPPSTLPCVSGSSANSSNSAIYQTTDPVNGNKALEVALPAGNAGLTPSTQNIPNGYFPHYYIEAAVRTDNPSGSPPYQNPAITGWYNNSQNIGAELDNFEAGNGAWDIALHLWTTGGSYGPDQVSNGSLDTGYHTYGSLWLGDGNGNFAMCGYFDGHKTGCATGTPPIDQSVLNNQRNYVLVYNSPSASQVIHNYWKYIKVITCANWRDPSINGMCTSSPLP
jgi:hypothetical protein